MAFRGAHRSRIPTSIEQTFLDQSRRREGELYPEDRSRKQHADRENSYGPQGVTRSTFSLVEWAEKPEVQQAWKELTAKHGLAWDPFSNIVQNFGVADSAIIGGWPLSLSIRKARKMGFHATVDSFQAAFETLKTLADLKVSAPLAVDAYKEDVI